MNRENPLEAPRGSTRRRILNTLKKSDGLTADQLAALLGVTSMAVRKHIAALERDGLVESTTVRRAIGRPANVYSHGSGETLVYHYNGAGPVPGAEPKKKKKDDDPFKRSSGGDWTCTASLVFENGRLERVTYAHKDVVSPPSETTSSRITRFFASTSTQRNRSLRRSRNVAW